MTRADGGGHVQAARRVVVGADAVARYLLGVIDKQRRRTTTTLTAAIEQINGRSGIILREGENLIAVVDLGIVGERVQQIALIVNPDKLTAPYWP